MVPMAQLFARSASNAIQIAMEPPVAEPTTMAPRMWHSDMQLPQALLSPTNPNGSLQKQDAKIDPTIQKGELTGLDMSGVRIRRFPEELLRFCFIAELRLADNFITELPREIASMRTLMYLDLSNNQLQMLPGELGKLTCLREILLYNNLLTVVPPELGFLYLLEYLGLDGNPIMDPTIQQLVHAQNSPGIISYLRDHCLSNKS